MLCLLYLCLFVSCIQSSDLSSLKRQMIPEEGDFCTSCIFDFEFCVDLEDTDDKTTCRTYIGRSEDDPNIAQFERRCYCGTNRKCYGCPQDLTGDETADANVKCPCLPICGPPDLTSMDNVCQVLNELGGTMIENCACRRGTACTDCHSSTLFDEEQGKDVTLQRCYCAAVSEPSFLEAEEEDDDYSSF